MGSPADPPPAPPAEKHGARLRRRRNLRWGAIGATGVAVAATVTVAAWPEQACTPEEREAVASVAPFGGVHTAVRPSLVDEGASAPGGCQVEYTVVADGDDVARYYADQLLAAGWAGLPDFWVDTWREEPRNIWYFRLDSPPRERLPAWEDLHFGVVIKELGSARVYVGTDVSKYVIQACC